MSKVLRLLGALMTLVATYVLTFFGEGPFIGWGYPALLTLPEIFADPASYAISLPPVMGYVIGIVLALFLLAGVLQLIGVASRGLGIIGGIIALLGSLFMVIVLFTGADIIPAQFGIYLLLFIGPPLVPGTIPYSLVITTTGLGTPVGLGLVVLILGGILGLVGQRDND